MNINEKCKEICAELRKNGFNTIKFKEVIEKGTDCFFACPDTTIHYGGAYAIFDYETFDRDFIKFVQKYVGSDYCVSYDANICVIRRKK